MRFKIDENLPIEIAEALQSSGFDARTVLEQGFQGKADDQIAAVCQREARALVTLDLDFADIRTYPPQDYPGLIVLRLARQDKLTVLNTMQRIIRMLEKEPLERNLWIVDERRVRIRGVTDD